MSEPRKIKISEFIEQLENAKSEHGDLEVNVFDSNEMADASMQETPAFITFGCDADGKVTSLTVVDYETASAFHDASSEESEG